MTETELNVKQHIRAAQNTVGGDPSFAQAHATIAVAKLLMEISDTLAKGLRK